MKVALSERTLLAVALANTALTVALVGAAAVSLRRPPPGAEAVAAEVEGHRAESVEAVGATTNPNSNTTSGVSNPPASPHPRDRAPHQDELGEGSNSNANPTATPTPAADDFEDARPPPGPPPPLAAPDPESPRAGRAPGDRVEFPRAAGAWGT